ncbi:hypothetical protein HED55_16850 [Ochrobactrum haematophilum]|uniref:Uncharacterized protein n=1 Tax=Brucella haematophila TaxID=419474 RepID=A0ABX1DMX0_9HYPH|nr:hypothetical protein [Brucella haematophila]
MRVSVLSLAAALAVFAFNAEAAPVSNLQATVQSGLLQRLITAAVAAGA